ncbi:MAG: ABC transporter ATP-binding protein [Candidatus Hodarchaeota archaeon]
MLKGEMVTKKFGGLEAVKNVDFYVDKKEIVSLIGPNGAGKTTLFNLISGLYYPDAGTIEFEGKNIVGLKPHSICRLGIARTYQIVKPFLKMTTLENVLVGVFYGKGKSINMTDAHQEALHWLEFIGMSEKKNVLAQTLTLADRKALEIARSLATEPELILLDEVIAGLNPAETSRAMDLIQKIWKELKIGVFWVEHVMKAVMGISHRVLVLDFGEKIAEGSPEEITENKKVIKAYLGAAYAKRR